MNQFPSNYVNEAPAKRDAGRALTSNEASRLARLEAQGRIPVRIPAAPSSPDPMDPAKPVVKIEDVPNLAQQLRRRGNGDSDAVASIIASGGVFVEKTGCDSGTPYTYWAPEWTSDPS
jgi:hypothetical protein